MSAKLISTGKRACFPLAEVVKAYSEGHCGAWGQRGCEHLSASEMCCRSLPVPFCTFVHAEGVKAYYIQRGKFITEVAKEAKSTSSSTLDHATSLLIIGMSTKAVDMGSYEQKFSWAYLFVLLS